MTLNITASEEQLIVNALVDYRANLIGEGVQYNTIIDILNKINDAGLVKAARTPKVMMLKQYQFSFVGGGWNTVWAKTLPGAKRQARLEYKDTALVPDYNSFFVASESSLKSAMSLFY